MRGIIDSLLIRFVDTLLAFPGLLIAIGILAALGSGIENVALAIGIGAFPRFARMSRARILVEASTDYALTARVVGATRAHIIFGHIGRNALPPFLIQGALTMAAAVLIEASLGYLGPGRRTSQPSLGNLINGARAHLDKW